MEAAADKARLEQELLAAQREKVLAEIAVLRRTTPFTETIKLVGSMVLGIGGALAALAGFQLAEVKAEKYKIEAQVALDAKKAAEAARQVAMGEFQRLQASRAQLQKEADDLARRIQDSKRDYALISDQLGAVQKQAATPAMAASLQALQQTVNAADIELRAALPPPPASTSGAPLEALVEKLFAPAAAARGAAYDELIARFSRDRRLVPELLAYAQQHMGNGNGVYNTLVVLGHLDHKALGSDQEAIRAFAAKARSVGPRTSERVDKLLERLPRA